MPMSGFPTGTSLEEIITDSASYCRLVSQLHPRGIVQTLQDMGEEGRITFWCAGADEDQTPFSAKDKFVQGHVVEPASCGMAFDCRRGVKPESQNQDSWFVLRTDTCSIYAVFDGHGPKGHDVSNFVKEYLPMLLIKDPRFKTESMPALLRDAFEMMHELIKAAVRVQKLDAQLSGTTATVCIQDHVRNKLSTAHIGDSAAVLGVISSCDKDAVEGIALTQDHTPSLPHERARIERSGGQVRRDSRNRHQVYVKGARFPVSRALGDILGQEAGVVTHDPEILERDLRPEDFLLLLCTYGIWAVATPAQAMRIISRFSSAEASTPATHLALKSWDLWGRAEGEKFAEDITVVLVDLKFRRKRSSKAAVVAGS